MTKILIVDDDPVSRRVLRQILASVLPDGGVEEAAGGEEACAQLEKKNHGFDLVFLDLSMPDYSGFDLLARFRRSEELKKLPVVLCTSSADRATVVKAVAAGAKHYVVKPPQPAIIAEKLRLVLGVTTAPIAASPNATPAPAPATADNQ